MNRLAAILRDFSISLWAGGLWTVGYLVAPLLFHAIDDRALAGTLAGTMFRGIAWVGIGCGTFLLLYECIGFKSVVVKRLVFWLILLMFGLTLIQQFWLQPFVAALRSAGAPVDAISRLPGHNFAFWHGIASALYLLESLLAVLLVVRSRRAY